MKILLAAVSASGHVGPVLSVGKILSESGHEVAMTTGSTFQKTIENAGITFLPLEAEVDLDLSDIDKAFPDRKNHEPGPDQLLFDAKSIFFDLMPGQFRSVQRHLQALDADVLVTDTFFSGMLPFLCAPSNAPRPAVVGVNPTPFYFHRSDGGPAFSGLQPTDDPEVQSKYREIAAGANAVFFHPATEHANALLQTLGCDPLPSLYTDAQNTLPDLVLQPSCADFEYPRPDMPDSVHFIGSLVRHTEPRPLPAELEQAVQSGKRVVLVSQGTVNTHDLSQLLAPALKGLATMDDVVVLGTTGGRPLSALPGSIPGNALVWEYLPVADLLPHLSAVVSNGGFGGVLEALSYGIPLVVSGVTEDKPEVCARIEWTGSGINLAAERVEPGQVRDAVEKVLTQPAFAERAKQLAASLAAIDTRKRVNELVQMACDQRSMLVS